MAETLSTIEHLRPAGVESTPIDVSVVVPALNEEITAGEFVDWCKQGLAKAGVDGQILIIDSSTDRTAEIVLAHGAKCSAHRNGDWVAPTSTPSVPFAADGSSWAMPI